MKTTLSRKTPRSTPTLDDVALAARQDDFEALAILLLGWPSANADPYVERISPTDKEEIVDFLIDVANGDRQFRHLDSDSQQRAAMAVCRILRTDPLHLQVAKR